MIAPCVRQMRKQAVISSHSVRLPEAPDQDQQGDAAALLIIDMISCFDFQGAEEVKPKAKKAAQVIDRFRGAMVESGMPVVYVNDNFGEWHSEKSRLVERTREAGSPVTDMLEPRPDDYFIIKPQFSGFYATNLPVLLPKLGVSRLILTGIATDICVLFTAADAHMRDYSLWIPQDAVAARNDERGHWALETMREGMGAETRPTSELALAAWLSQTSVREA